MAEFEKQFAVITVNIFKVNHITTSGFGYSSVYLLWQQFPFTDHPSIYKRTEN